MTPSLKTYLVMVDHLSTEGTPIAGIYVQAFSKPEAEQRVRTMLSEAVLTTYQKSR